MVDSKTPNFRAIIVGGGIAGLTVANALQAAKIDFILLEGRGEHTSVIGGVVMLDPCSGRILDQLGCYKELEDGTIALSSETQIYPDGDEVVHRKDWLNVWGRRLGYDMRLMERSKIIRTLTEHIQDFEDKILLNKRVVRVDHSKAQVVVRCDDGTVYHGDVVLGCDGVHSRIRQEMWRAADDAEPGKIPASEMTLGTAEYRVMYGVSPPNPLIKHGTITLLYGYDTNRAIMCGKDGEISFFLLQRLPKKLEATEIPRYTDSDAMELAESMADMPMLTNGALKFRDVWQTRERYNLHALVEAAYEHWSWGRFGLVGEASIKQSPNAGMGANCAIDNATATANALYFAVTQAQRRGKSKPSYEELQAALSSAREVRRARADAAVMASGLILRAHTLYGLPYKIMLFLTPYMTDFKLDMIADAFVGGMPLEYLPPPPRSLNGTMPFNPEQGIGHEESRAKRALKALPFLVIAAFSYFTLHKMVPMDQIQSIIKQGRLQRGDASMELLPSFFGIPPLDTFARIGTVAFSPSWLGTDKILPWLWFTFGMDVGLIHTLLHLEANRAANSYKIFRLQVLIDFLILFLGGAVIEPIYFFLLYVFSPVEIFKGSENRLINVSYAKTFLPVMAVVYYLPHVGSHIASDLMTRQKLAWIYQTYNVWVPLTQWLLARFFLRNTFQQDKLYNIKRDMKYIRVTLGTLCLVCSASWLYTFYYTPYSFSEIRFPSRAVDGTLGESMRRLLQWDEWIILLNSQLWILYSFSDLKNAGMMNQSWLSLALVQALAYIVGGPGVALAIGWWRREEVLASKRHKGAIVKGWDEKKTS